MQRFGAKRLEFLQMEARDGEDIPAFRGRPVPDGRYMPFLQAWEELAQTRPAGMGFSHVTFTEFRSFCWLHNIRRDAAQMLWTVVRALEAEMKEIARDG